MVEVCQLMADMKAQETKTNPKRPFGITLLIIGSLLMGVFSIIRFQQALSLWDYLQNLLTIPILYYALTGAVWGMVWLFVAGILFRAYSWSPLVVRFVLVAYVIYYWLDRLLLVDPESQVTNEWFAAVATLGLMIWVFLMFSFPTVKRYFGDHYES